MWILDRARLAKSGRKYYTRNLNIENKYQIFYLIKMAQKFNKYCKFSPAVSKTSSLK
jgi:hypothetical protein